MARAKDNADELRERQLEKLVHIETKVAEAAEAAAEAATHAVEATKAAEAASVARATKKAESAKTAKAVKAANTAKAKAARASRAAKAASTATVPDALLTPSRSTQSRQKPRNLLEVTLTDDELEKIRLLAAEKKLSVTAFARSVLVAVLRADAT